MNIRHFTFNIFQENTYVIWDKGPDCVAVDPAFSRPDEREAFFGLMESEGLKVSAILLTHCHFDHVYGVKELQDLFGCPVYMDPKEVVNLEYNDEVIGKLGLTPPDGSFTRTDISDGETISAAGIDFKVISTPGHAPGAVCFLVEKENVMFTGDTLFAGTIGRTDLKYSEYDDEIRSIMEKLIILPGDIDILPGHGPGSTILDERYKNPFLEPFNEPEETFNPDLEGIEINPLS